jgi:AcrR family transcriptional regulator
MSGRMDRRTQKTRVALMGAFVELVLSRGYDAVGVEDIARKANVARSTFYLHYAGKEALLKESLTRPSSGLAACVGRNATPETLTPLLDHFREQRHLNRAFFEYPLRSLWVNNLATLIEVKLSDAARASGGGLRVRLPRSIFALTLAEMQIALIAHWLATPVPVKSRVIAETLVLNTRGMLASMQDPWMQHGAITPGAASGRVS